jgi:hypothetical protein
MLKRRVRGEIAYVHDSKGLTGREYWSIAVAADGRRTLTANCVLFDTGVQRDVVYSVDSAFRPEEAFVRLALHGKFQGSTWFRFSDRGAEAEGVTMTDGRFSQRFATAARPQIFGPHPLQADAWQTAACSRESPGERQFLPSCLNSSPRADGGSGPLLHATWKHISYEGERQIEVLAGRYHCDHYRIYPRDFAAPLEIYVFDEDRILALCTWEVLQSRYELARLEELS